MKTQEIYVRVLDSKPLYTGRLSDAKSLAYLVLGGLAALFTFVAFQVAGLLYAGLWLGMGLMCASSILIVRAQVGAITIRTVRAASVGPLRFVPRRRIALSYFITAMCGLFAGTCAIVGIFTFAEGFHPHYGRRSPGAIFIVSVVWLAQMAWSLRRRAGRPQCLGIVGRDRRRFDPHFTQACPSLPALHNRRARERGCHLSWFGPRRSGRGNQPLSTEPG